MTQVDFYSSLLHPTEKILPKFLEKAIENKIRTLLILKDEEALNFYNRYLWTYSSNFFLAHGASMDSYPEDQPVYLSTNIKDNANNAKLIVSTEPLPIDDILKFDRYIYIFKANAEEENEAIYKYYNEIKEVNTNLNCQQQDKQGKWIKKEI